MLSKRELEKLEVNMLAMYCLRVAENAPAGSAEAEEARKLRQEWSALIGRGGAQGLDTPEDKEAWGQRLKSSMVQLLSDCPYVGPAHDAAPSRLASKKCAAG